MKIQWAIDGLMPHDLPTIFLQTNKDDVALFITFFRCEFQSNFLSKVTPRYFTSDFVSMTLPLKFTFRVNFESNSSLSLSLLRRLRGLCLRGKQDDLSFFSFTDEIVF